MSHIKIYHKIDDFFYTIFPKLEGKKEEEIIGYIKDYYSYGPYKPVVVLKDGILTIDIDVPSIVSQREEYAKAINLCEKRRYEEAIPILKNLIQKNPTNSEYHRVMGQIFFDRNEIEDSMDYLISALRWDSRNKSALTMMGNLLFRNKNDSESAMKYYNQVLLLNPEDYIVINNIAVNYLQLKDYKKAEEYFQEVLRINPEYPNTYLGLGMLSDFQSDYYPAFEFTLKALKYDKKKELYQNTIKQLFNISQKIIKEDKGQKIYQKYIEKLEYEAKKPVRILLDDNIPTIAKIEIAENYSRDYHLIRYKDSQPAYEHLLCHELVHLDFIIQARKIGQNQLFTSSQKNERVFRKNIETTISKLKGMGVPPENIEGYTSSLFSGLNSQIYNTPIDLFIEQFLFDTYPELRPYQLISLHNMVLLGKKGVTDKNIVEIIPKDILTKSRIYNLVSAIQIKELFGIDYLSEFNAPKNELKTAQDFYDEFLEYRDDRSAGEEYEILQHWADDLGLSDYFELVDENEHNKSKDDIDELLGSIEKDPYGLLKDDPELDKETKDFILKHKSDDLNMSVVFHMVGALGFFNNMSKDKIKEIAFEIAMLGRLGFNENENNYRVNSIPNKSFTMYQILSYYYVSWALSIPEMLSQIQLPFDKEFELAKKVQGFRT